MCTLHTYMTCICTCTFIFVFRFPPSHPPPSVPSSLLLSCTIHSKFTQTALEIYNTASVTITNSTFTDNICKGQGQLRNSGNAGAVSIGYNETYPPETSPLIHIMNCTFTGNEARLPTSECGDTNSALSRKMYVQRGGGIGCYFSAPSLQVYSS